MTGCKVGKRDGGAIGKSFLNQDSNSGCPFSAIGLYVAPWLSAPTIQVIFKIIMFNSGILVKKHRKLQKSEWIEVE